MKRSRLRKKCLKDRFESNKSGCNRQRNYCVDEKRKRKDAVDKKVFWRALESLL